MFDIIDLQAERIFRESYNPECFIQAMKHIDEPIGAFVMRHHVRFRRWVTETLEGQLHFHDHRRSRPDIFTEEDVQGAVLRHLWEWGRLYDLLRKENGVLGFIHMHIRDELIHFDLLQ